MAIVDAVQLNSFRERTLQALQEGRLDEAKEHADEISAAQLSSVLRDIPQASVLELLRMLERRHAGAVMGNLPPELAARLAADMADGELASIFTNMPSDSAARVYRVLQDAEVERLQRLLDRSTSQKIVTLAKYPPDSAGSIMTSDFMAIRGVSTVGQVIEIIRTASSRYEHTFYVYFVTSDGRLRGVASLRDLVRYSPQQSVESAMTTEVIAVHVSDTAETAARRLRNRRFMMLPVVEEDGILVGVVTFDDAMRVLVEEVADDLIRIGGLSSDESFFTPPLGAVRKRLPWMAGNVFLNLGAVSIISFFEETIMQVAILAAFLPMITDMGGNIGIQALSVAIRSIALGDVQLRDFWGATRKELIVGTVNGVLLGLLFGVIALLLQGNMALGLIAGVALSVNVVVAGIVGGTMPFVIRHLGYDPALMTGPILTTITDITGVSIYLGLSALFLTSIMG